MASTRVAPSVAPTSACSSQRVWGQGRIRLGFCPRYQARPRQHVCPLEHRVLRPPAENTEKRFWDLCQGWRFLPWPRHSGAVTLVVQGGAGASTRRNGAIAGGAIIGVMLKMFSELGVSRLPADVPSDPQFDDLSRYSAKFPVSSCS